VIVVPRPLKGQPSNPPIHDPATELTIPTAAPVMRTRRSTGLPGLCIPPPSDSLHGFVQEGKEVPQPARDHSAHPSPSRAPQPAQYASPAQSGGYDQRTAAPPRQQTYSEWPQQQEAPQQQVHDQPPAASQQAGFLLHTLLRSKAKQALVTPAPQQSQQKGKEVKCADRGGVGGGGGGGS